MTVTMTPFLNFLSPKWLCCKSSLTHPKCTKSHLQRSRFQKFFPWEKPPDPRFWGGRFAVGEGVGREGKKREGRGKGRGCRGARKDWKVVCPGARAGSWWAWVRWSLLGGLLHLVQQRGDWAGTQPAQAPPRHTKCNSPPINGQWPSHHIAVLASVAPRF